MRLLDLLRRDAATQWQVQDIPNVRRRAIALGFVSSALPIVSPLPLIVAPLIVGEQMSCLFPKASITAGLVAAGASAAILIPLYNRTVRHLVRKASHYENILTELRREQAAQETARVFE